MIDGLGWGFGVVLVDWIWGGFGGLDLGWFWWTGFGVVLMDWIRGRFWTKMIAKHPDLLGRFASRLPILACHAQTI